MITELAVALTLTVGAGLLARSSGARFVAAGFRARAPSYLTVSRHRRSLARAPACRTVESNRD